MRRKQRDFRKVAIDAADLDGARAESILAWKVDDTPLRAKGVIRGTFLAGVLVLVYRLAHPRQPPQEPAPRRA
ncbi:MAG: hypothetical protein JWR01_2898 [Subtercola sp.]|nr:hypothetical protein [Subtercola sp.]